MSLDWRISAADRRLLPEGRLAGPMPWVIAIMVFLTVLATAAGLGLNAAASSLNAELSGRVTVQVIEANPTVREQAAARIAAALDRLSNVRAVKRVDDKEVMALLRPWLGNDAIDPDLPVPALIDADLKRVDDRALAEIDTTIRAISPNARADAHARWLSPLARLFTALKWLAVGLVVLMGIATAASVVLAARAALDTHRPTIDVLHLLGATDGQIARLFQRRIALDALFSGMLGFLGGAIVILLLAIRIDAVGADLLGSIRLSRLDWLWLLAVPCAGTLVATFSSRLTVIRALRRRL